MKVRASVKKICAKCKVVRRKGVVRIICDEPAPQAEAGLRKSWLVSLASTFRATSAWRSRSPTSTASAGHAATSILEKAEVSPDKRTDDLDENDVRAHPRRARGRLPRSKATCAATSR